MTQDASQPGRLLDSLRSLASTLLAAIETRIELLSVEVEEERARLAVLVVLAAITAVCFAFAALLAVLFIVVVFWDTHRLAALGGMAVIFALAGAGFLAALRRQVREGTRLFSASVAELRKDRAALDDRHPPR